MVKRRSPFGAIALYACTLSACIASGDSEPLSASQYVLGTVCTIDIFKGGNQEALDLAFTRLREIERRMSANTKGTDLESVNESAGRESVKVPDDLYYVVEKALTFWRQSDRAFDPTVGPLVKLWNIGFDNAHVPAKKDIQKALSLLGGSDVRLDHVSTTIKLLRPGMRLDLGAIAKGYAGDEVTRILTERGVTSAVADIGGNIVVIGSKGIGRPWRVGIQNPFDLRGEYIGILTFSESKAIVTSGIYERYFEAQGEKYHHILDTTTGFPVDNGLVSVTIFSDSSIDADGLSTSVFALGKEWGMELLKQFPNTYAIVIDSAKNVYISPGTSVFLSITDKAFRLMD